MPGPVKSILNLYNSTPNKDQDKAKEKSDQPVREYDKTKGDVAIGLLVGLPFFIGFVLMIIWVRFLNEDAKTSIYEKFKYIGSPFYGAFILVYEKTGFSYYSKLATIVLFLILLLIFAAHIFSASAAFAIVSQVLSSSLDLINRFSTFCSRFDTKHLECFNI